MAKTAEERRKERAEKAVERLRRRQQKIREWMYDGNVYDSAPLAARAPGVPPGNIIEERRLAETLYEIGKKRIEYMNSYENERFRFHEKQKRKSSAVRRLLLDKSDVISRGWTVDERSLGREDTYQTVSGGTRRPSPINKTPEETDIEMQNKLDSMKQGVPTLVKENTTQSSKGKAVQFSVFQTEAHFSRENTKQSRHISRNPTFEKIPSIIREKPIASPIPWGKMKSTSIQPGTHLPPLVSDPRYRKLEKSLCPVYISKRKKDISAIVNRFNSLHIPPNQIRVSKFQKEQQIKQFMKERGLVF